MKQAEANYRRGTPINHCGICVFYQGHRCSKVEGAISPYGLSDVYRPEKNPFGGTLSPNEKAAIEAMAADRATRAPQMGRAGPPMGSLARQDTYQ